MNPEAIEMVKALRSVRALRRKPVAAKDGRIGGLLDVLFDDRTWAVRYFVVDNGRPMPQRHVLVEPHRVAERGDVLQLSLARGELERCPDLDEHKPVYLQHDMASVASRGDSHLRSSEVMLGSVLRTPAGAAGRLRDLLLDPGNWTVAYLVDDTGVWLPGKRVLVEPRQVERIDWIERAVWLRGVAAQSENSVAPRIAP
ncbi:MAG TPA: hypothetical protein VJT77_01085 [Burkholderiales bacterium]|nr:hypothetical protein [Burkholderiales bacterium]